LWAYIRWHSRLLKQIKDRRRKKSKRHLFTSVESIVGGKHAVKPNVTLFGACPSTVFNTLILKLVASTFEMPVTVGIPSTIVDTYTALVPSSSVINCPLLSNRWTINALTFVCEPVDILVSVAGDVNSIENLTGADVGNTLKWHPFPFIFKSPIGSLQNEVCDVCTLDI
jgi:hypothetical protein